jgi:hypothetical protein
VLVGLPQGVGGLAFLFYFILAYFYNTHPVLVGLPQGVGGLAILIYFRLYCCSLFYFYNTHQVLVGLPQRVGGLAILYIIRITFKFKFQVACFELPRVRSFNFGFPQVQHGTSV